MHCSSWKNQDANCHAPLSVNYHGMAGHVARSDCEVFKKSAVYQVHWMGPMMIHCGMTVKKEE